MRPTGGGGRSTTARASKRGTAWARLTRGRRHGRFGSACGRSRRPRETGSRLARDRSWQNWASNRGCACDRRRASGSRKMRFSAPFLAASQLSEPHGIQHSEHHGAPGAPGTVAEGNPSRKGGSQEVLPPQHRGDDGRSPPPPLGPVHGGQGVRRGSRKPANARCKRSATCTGRRPANHARATGAYATAAPGTMRGIWRWGGRAPTAGASGGGGHSTYPLRNGGHVPPMPPRGRGGRGGNPQGLRLATAG